MTVALYPRRNGRLLCVGRPFSLFFFPFPAPSRFVGCSGEHEAALSAFRSEMRRPTGISPPPPFFFVRPPRFDVYSAVLEPIAFFPTPRASNTL